MKSERSVFPVDGVRLGTVRAGIRKPDRPDLVVMEIAAGSTCAAVFTRNAFCAAPVTVAREHLASHTPRYLVINTGYANAGTGQPGLVAARETCTGLAGLAGCEPGAVLPFSTGVIGEPLPLEVLLNGLPEAMNALSESGWTQAAAGIVTTDTVEKLASRRIELDGGTVTVTGMAKGAGMIRPDMATMLAFVATDAVVDRQRLQDCLQGAVDQSFNRITVDGDTSTNDACVLVATGRAGGAGLAGDDFERFAEAVGEVCRELARAIVRDGEGATKLITVCVEGGRDTVECSRVAYTVAHSPLVKTAFFAGDPNWGRILAAVGRAPLEGLDIAKVDIYLGELCIVRRGDPDPEYREARGAEVMAQDEITIRIVLGRGTATHEVWTCDLSYDYVRINAEYRT